VVKAIVFDRGSIRVEEREMPPLKPDEVLVKMGASAICRSDLHLLHGQGPVGGTAPRPIVPGHEPAGTIVDGGSHTAKARVGERVAVYLGVGCEQCEACEQGWPLLCQHVQFIGVDRDGGDQEFLAVPSRNCLPIPDQMTFDEAALSLDTVGGLYWTSKRIGISGQDVVGIFGLGPMGTAGILVAKALGATVVGIDVNPRRRDLGTQLGADHVLDSSAAEFREAVMAMTHGQGFSAVVECSGNPAAQNAALDSAGRFGRVAFMGESSRSIFNPSDQFIRKLLTVVGGWYFPRWGYYEIVRFIFQHRLPLRQLATHVYGLEDAQTAFDQFDQGLTGKVLFSGE
jgi:threonine dehydrogenase-like Zn-dependent dehydrogenase